MKVKELIAILGSLDQEKKVNIMGVEGVIIETPSEVVIEESVSAFEESHGVDRDNLIERSNGSYVLVAPMVYCSDCVIECNRRSFSMGCDLGDTDMEIAYEEHEEKKRKRGE